MAIGWAGDGAVDSQIQDSINDEIARVRTNIEEKESLEYCKECGEEIPKARREAIKGCEFCISCQNEVDKENLATQYYNRRGSKDSQLK